MKFSDITKPKNRPFLIGAVALGAVAIYFTTRGGAPSTQTAVANTSNSGPSEAFLVEQMRTNAELSAMQLQAQTQMNLAAQELEGSLALASFQTALAQQEFGAQLAAIEMQTSAQLEVAQTQGALERDRLASEETRELAQLATTAAMFDTTAQIQRETAQLNAFMFESSLQANLIEEQYERDLEIERLRTGASIESQQIDADLQLGRQQLKNQKRAGDQSFIGGVIGGVLGIFSDVRVKSDIRQVGETPQGLPLYTYKVGGETQAGVMAHDAALYNPAIVHMSGDYAMVDYGAL